MTDGEGPVTENGPSPEPFVGEPRWPMALAVVATGVLRATLPPEFRNGDARFLFFAVLLVLLVVLIIGDPGRIDKEARWMRVLTALVIGLITVVNTAAAIRLVIAILASGKFANDARELLASGGAIWLTNVIAFGLWYWCLDRGGPVTRAKDPSAHPDFIFPEMTHAQFMRAGWYPKFPDYLHLSFTTATAFSPTDVSAVRPWSKMMMIAEASTSLLLAILVVSRAVNIL
jgi:hypothetical protein